VAVRAKLAAMEESQVQAPAGRLREIDLLRGLVIALMALDHTRDYFHASCCLFDPLDPAHTNWALYLTRWVTHLCAPTFVLLAGVSIYLQSAKGKSRPALTRFLVTRGLWLIVLELTVINFAWTFVIPGFPFLQVIWAIGWSMIALAALVWLPRIAVLAIGLAIVVGHNLLDPIQPAQFGAFGWLWQQLHAGGLIMQHGQPAGLDAYPILPWAGLMATGYGLGGVFTAAPEQRNRTIFMLGGAMLVVFVVLRFTNFYGDPRPWAPQHDLSSTLMMFFNVTKYPPSLLYVCATLGLVFVAFPLLARLRGVVAKVLLTFGAVPFFAYVLHIFFVHSLALLTVLALHRDVGTVIDPIRKSILEPAIMTGFGVPLWAVYVAWMVVLALLYPLCLWWAGVKRTRRDWWLSYL
jgi:uncharacterized membrane protein